MIIPSGIEKDKENVLWFIVEGNVMCTKGELGKTVIIIDMVMVVS